MAKKASKSFPAGKCRCVVVTRGNLAMFHARVLGKSTGLPLIHTTNLHEGILREPMIRIDHGTVMRGHAVLIPRVGEPSPKKICLAEVDESYVLSDCVLGLQGLSTAMTHDLYHRMQAAASGIMSLYGGTGAPYTTLTRVNNFLLDEGFMVVPQGTNMCQCSRINDTQSMEAVA